MKRNLLYIGIAMLLGGPMNADEADRIALCRVQDQMTESTKRMVIQDDESDQPVYVENTPIITDHEISSAKMAGGNEVAILFTVTEAGEKILGSETKKMFGKRLAILINGKLIAAPVVRNPFSTGFMVTGNFDRGWAESLVRKVNAEPKG